MILLSEVARRNPDRAALGGELATLMDTTNAALDPHEQLQFGVVVREPWTIDNGF